jgi:hypothetical protein
VCALFKIIVDLLASNGNFHFHFQVKNRFLFPFVEKLFVLNIWTFGMPGS